MQSLSCIGPLLVSDDRGHSVEVLLMPKQRAKRTIDDVCKEHCERVSTQAEWYEWLLPQMEVICDNQLSMQVERWSSQLAARLTVAGAKVPLKEKP